MLRDIMVCVNDTLGRDNTIQVAAQLAVEQGARLTGLYISSDELEYAVPPLGFVSNDMVENILSHQQEQANIAKENFNNIASSIGCESTWHMMSENERPLVLMLYTDLIVIDQPNKEAHRSTFNDEKFVNRLILETAKPILTIPPKWEEGAIGKRILLGWNETREAIRALQDSLPLMEKAQKVDVVTVDYRYDKDAELKRGVEIGNFLARKGIDSQFHAGYLDQQLDNEESVLLAHAHDYGSDLIVIGGYGHSRLRQIVLGGVTRYLTNNSDVPVLLSH